MDAHFALAISIVMFCSPGWAASCGTEADDGKRITIAGIVDFVEEDVVDGKAYTYVSVKECSDVEMILGPEADCEKGERISASGTFWWCDDLGTYSDGVECDWEHALEAAEFICSR